MKKLIALCVVLVACGGGGGGSGSSPSWSEKIKDWQQREATCPPVVTSLQPYGRDLAFDLVALANQFPAWTQVAEQSGNDHWKTSYESLQTLEGDCEDAAFLFHRALIDSTLPAIYPGIDARIRIVRHPDAIHLMVIVHWQDQTWEISNMQVHGEFEQDIIAEFDHEFIYQL